MSLHQFHPLAYSAHYTTVCTLKCWIPRNIGLLEPSKTLYTVLLMCHVLDGILHCLSVSTDCSPQTPLFYNQILMNDTQVANILSVLFIINNMVTSYCDESPLKFQCVHMKAGKVCSGFFKMT